MKWIDFKAGIRDFWDEFKRVKFGLFGIILFIDILQNLITIVYSKIDNTKLRKFASM